MKNQSEEGLELREAEFAIEIRSVEERIISGRAVPYNFITDLGGYKEQFTPGAFDGADPSAVTLYGRSHKEPVGRILALRSKPDGLYFDGQFSDTVEGRDAWTLVKDKVTQYLSIAFAPVASGDVWSADKSLVTRTKAALAHISTTDRPAYKPAVILATREESPNPETEGKKMPEDIKQDPPAPTEVRDARVDDLLERTEEIAKAVTLLGEKHSTKTPEPMFRSFGEYFQARARGDENAEILYRALSDNTLADNDGVNPESWLKNIYGLINHGRPVASAFGVEPLSTSGTTEHWPLVTSMPTHSIIAENADLSSALFTIEDQSATIKTYAAGGAISRMVLDRSAPSYIDAIGRAMSASYGKKTESDFVAALIAAATVSTAFDAHTLAAYVEGIANAAVDVYEDSEFTADLLVISKDVFIEWASLAASDGRPAFTLAGAGVNTIGNLSIPALGGNFASLPVVMSLSAAAGTVLLGASSAAKFREASGSPFELNADEIVTMKKGYAVYGYGSPVVYQPAAIRKIALAA